MYSLRRFVDFCDSWIPFGRSLKDPQAQMDRLKHFADEKGRDMQTISVSLFGARPDRDYLEHRRTAGIDRALFALPSDNTDSLLPLIDRFSQFI